MPPILDSDLNDAGVFQLIPSATYNGQIIVCEIKRSKGNAPMAVSDWQILETPNSTNEFLGRKVRFDNVMLGGMSKDNKPLSLGQLCSLMYYAGIPWQCKQCGAKHEGLHSFLLATKEDAAEGSGLKVGNYYCPACKNPKPGMVWDTDHLLNARCGISIGSKKEEGGDREFNYIRGYADLQV